MHSFTFVCRPPLDLREGYVPLVVSWFQLMILNSSEGIVLVGDCKYVTDDIRKLLVRPTVTDSVRTSSYKDGT